MIYTTTQMAHSVRENLSGFIAEGREFYCGQILQTAQSLKEHIREAPIVLLAGPSGSGKTTSALLLERQLERWGIGTHTLSMDNYFCPLSAADKLLLEQHKLDLESPNRVDSAFLNEQLSDLLAGKTVQLPRYDFATSSRVFDGNTLTKKEGEVVIMEGIHALNPSLTGAVGQFTAHIYVSVRTRVQSKDGTVLHPSKIRLMRRILRDHISRGRPVESIIRMAPSVDAGEEKYIMPYKNRAEYQIDTFIPYELSVYKADLLEKLAGLEGAFPELEDIIKILAELEPIDEALVPADSLLREFIGGSELPY